MQVGLSEGLVGSFEQLNEKVETYESRFVSRSKYYPRVMYYHLLYLLDGKDCVPLRKDIRIKTITSKTILHRSLCATIIFIACAIRIFDMGKNSRCLLIIDNQTLVSDVFFTNVLIDSKVHN